MLSRFRLAGACILCAALFVASLLFLNSPDHTTVDGRMANETSFTLDARFGTGPVRERAVKEGRDVKRPSQRAAATLRRSERQQKVALKRFERKLASPAWKREREKSRTAFRDLAPTEALEAVTDQHEQLIGRPTATDLSLRKAEKLVAYESPTEARVELADGKLARVESVNVPLATPADGPGGNGPLVPVQLGLLDRGASWSPKRPAVDTTLPKQASVNATLGDELALALPNKRGAGTLVEEAKVFYPNQLPDTDVVLEPRNAGLEISWVLRSPDSPSLLPLDLKGRRGQALKFRLEGAGKVSALFGDRTVAQVSPVFAWDAQGRSVKGEYVVSPDGGLSVSVDHAQQDLAYPIVVDPLVRESWQEPGYNTPAMLEDWGGGRAGWVFSDYSGQANVFFKSWYYEPWLGISMAAGNPGGYARWTFGPLRESAIFRVKFLNFRRDIGEANTTLGLLYGQNFDNNSLFYLAEFPNGQNNYSGTGAHRFGPWGSNPVNVTICTWYPTCSYGGSKNNQAVFEMSGRGVPRSSAVGAAIDGALVYHRENDAPVIQSFGFFQAPQNGWFRQPRLSAQLQLNDAGIGFCDDGNLVNGGLASHPLTVTDHNASQLTNFGWQIQGGCAGMATHMPAEPQINPIWQEGYEANYDRGSTIPDGVRTLRFTARDMFGNASTHTEDVKIDRVAPRVLIGGRLAAYTTEREGTTGPLPPGIRTLIGLSDLTIEARDSKPNNVPTTSGVASVAAKVWRLDDAGNRVAEVATLPVPAASCTGYDDCDRSPIRIDSGSQGSPGPISSLASGLYQLEVTAADRAGNSTTSAHVFAIGGGEITSVVEGQGTARWVPLAAERPGATNATFQWKSGTRNWAALPIAPQGEPVVLATESEGTRVESAEVATNGGKTGRYVLDIDALVRRVKVVEPSFPDLTADRLQVRAAFGGTGSTYERLSEDVAVRIDRGGRDTSDATAALGPGNVDLLTGNYSIEATDASIDGYHSTTAFTRTYGSRYVRRGDGTPFAEKDNGVLGPGWTMSLPATGDTAFVRVVDLNDAARGAFEDRFDPASPTYDARAIPETRYGAVRVEAADGTGFVFEQRESDGSFVAEAGYEQFTLSRAFSNGVTQSFTLKDKQEDTSMTFASRLDDPAMPWYEGLPEHGTFGITSVDAIGGAGKPTWRYQAFGAAPTLSASGAPVIDAARQTLPVRALAAFDGSISCAADQALERGCQAIDLTYFRHPQADKYRLQSISVTATDPNTGQPRTEQVASYTYYDTVQAPLKTVTDLKSGLAVTYAYESNGLITSVAPPGEEPHQFTYESHNDDKTLGRLREFKRPALPGTAISTVVYSDRTFGGINPWDLGAPEIQKWGQTVTPYRAAAILPPGVDPAGLTADKLKKSPIYYLDALGRQINQALPGGRISADELDKWGNVTRSLSAENRAAALAQSAMPTAEAALRRSNLFVFADDGRGQRRVVKTMGPETSIKLPGSTATVRGRRVSLTDYDEGFDGTDPKMPYNLPTTVRSGALVGAAADGQGGTLQDVRKTTTQYQLSSREPIKIIENADGGAAAVVKRIVRDSEGREIERRQPSSPGTDTKTTAGSATDASSTVRTTYYTSGANADDAGCGNRPEWSGMACTVGPAGSQPSSGLRKLPSRKLEYDFWRRDRRVVETATNSSGNEQTRTTTTTYDAKGRPFEEEIVGVEATAGLGSSVGAPVSKIRHVYDEATGHEVETHQLDGNGASIRRVKRTYDTLGRMTRYEDGSGAVTVNSFDERSRLTGTSWSYGSGTSVGGQTFAYDSITGDLQKITDSSLDAANPIQASYNADGRVTSVTYPSGVVKNAAYDETGEQVLVSYTKTVGCTSGCIWYSNKATYSAHGQMVDDESTLSNRAYTYDALGRLTSTKDMTTGSACVTRTYEYDVNSNRTSKRTASGATCPEAGAGGTVVTAAYDAADRMTSATGYGLGSAPVTYDAWGRVLTLPKQAANGGLTVEPTYFVNDLARTIRNGTVTVTNELDPLGRIRTRSTQTTGQATVPLDTYAYGEDSDAPVFTRGSTGANPGNFTSWSRYVADQTGGFAVQVTNAGVRSLQVANLRGDVVSEIAWSTTATGLGAKFAVDEFGVPTGTSVGFRKFAFLGSRERESLLYGNVISVGVRLYSPHSGRFLQPDPVVGGSDNTYDYATQDPVNESDDDGRKPQRSHGKKRNDHLWTYHRTVKVYAKVQRKDGSYTGKKKLVGSYTVNLTLRFNGGQVVARQTFKESNSDVMVYPNDPKCAEDNTGWFDGNCGDPHYQNQVTASWKPTKYKKGTKYYVRFTWGVQAGILPKYKDVVVDTPRFYCTRRGCKF